MRRPFTDDGRYRRVIDGYRSGAQRADADEEWLTRDAPRLIAGDNGIVQEIDTVSIDEAPVSMLLVLDTRTSVEAPTLGI